LNTQTPRALIEAYVEALCQMHHDPEVKPFAMYHEDVTYTLPGLWPMGDTYRGLDDFMERLATVAGPRMKGVDGGGMFAEEYICEGDKVVVIGRGRTRNARDMPYNNCYFLWFEIRDGKIFNYLEDLDSSLAWQHAFDVHIEDA
jgi:ketosteroid isomerase-like protein